MRFEGKVAIITGSGTGIGRDMAIAFAREGAHVTVAARRKELLEETASLAEQPGGERPFVVPTDITSEAQVDSMVDRTVERYGRVDFMINNAAYAKGRDRVPTVELEQDVFQKVVDVKVLGTFLCSKAVANVLIDQKRGGKIINVSSGAGKSGDPNMLAYGAACFAQIGMTQTLARELGPYGINVNCVCPGLVDTSRVDDIGRGEAWEEYAQGVPIRRLGTDEELGAFVAYLCTKAASWIHGQSINIDGGEVMTH